MSDVEALVQFKSGWERSGTGSDGLPLYKQTVRIQMDKPPYLSVERVATQEDFEMHPLPHQLYQQEEAARVVSYSEGYPLSMWPAVNEAEFRMLADRDITTVEQLASLVKRGANTQNMPAELRDLAQRAVKLMELQKGAAKYEELLKERDGRIEALEEQVRDALQTIASQKTTINELRLRGVG